MVESGRVEAEKMLKELVAEGEIVANQTLAERVEVGYILSGLGHCRLK